MRAALPSAPKRLSTEARRWWKRLVTGYEIDDDGGLLVLQTGLEAFDRMRSCQSRIAIDGRSREGSVWPMEAASVARRGTRRTQCDVARAAATEHRRDAGRTLGSTATRRPKRTTRHQGPGIDPSLADALLDEIERTHPTRARELWQHWRGELLDDWVAEHPGTRPAAWWTHEASEPRRQLSGYGVLASERYRNLVVPIDRGVPAFDSVNADDPPRYESEAAYLRRCGVLTGSELRRLPRAAFEPEAIALDDD